MRWPDLEKLRSTASHRAWNVKNARQTSRAPLPSARHCYRAGVADLLQVDFTGIGLISQYAHPTSVLFDAELIPTAGPQPQPGIGGLRSVNAK